MVKPIQPSVWSGRKITNPGKAASGANATQDGWIIGGINLLVDITDRKTAEIEAHEQFRAIVAKTPECVTTIARDGTLIFMSPPGLVMVGANAADVDQYKKLDELPFDFTRRKMSVLVKDPEGKAILLTKSSGRGKRARQKKSWVVSGSGSLPSE